MPCPKQTCINAWYIRKILGRFPARLPALPCRLPAPPRHASGQPFHNAGMDRERRGTVPASVALCPLHYGMLPSIPFTMPV